MSSRFLQIHLLVPCIVALGLILILYPGGADGANVDDFIDFSSSAGYLPGRLYVPPEAVGSASPHPLILSLHGHGAIGNDNLKQIGANIDNLLDASKLREAYLYAPQSSSSWRSSGSLIKNEVIAMIDLALADHNVDSNRLYVTGLSSGGGGTWEVLNDSRSDRFAAGVPIAGTGSSFSAGRIVGKPVWAFHARNDGTVDVEKSRLKINSILSTAGEPTLTFPPLNDTITTFEYVNDALRLKYTEWPTGGHGIWGQVYNTTEMYDWMFSQTLAIPEPTTATLATLALCLITTRRRR